MTLLGKALFSLLLVGGGFGLASVFGPPDLADKLADQLTPGKPVDPWGELRPAPASQPWATFAANEADRVTAPPPGMGYPASPYPPSRHYADAAAGSMAGQASAYAAPFSSTYRDTSVRPAAAVQPAGEAGWPAAPLANRAPVTNQRPSAPPVVAPAWGPIPQAGSQPVRPDAPTEWPAPAAGESAQRVSSPAWRAAAYRRPAPPRDAWERAYRSEPPAATLLPPRPGAADPGDAWGEFNARAPGQPNAAPLTDSPWPNEESAALDAAAFDPPEAGLARAADSRFADEAFESDFAAPPLGVAEPRATRIHIVADGDTLASLARRYLGDSARAEELFARNRGLLSHPDLLPIGAELEIGPRPAAPAGSSEFAPAPDPADANNQTPRARLLAPQPSAYAGPLSY